VVEEGGTVVKEIVYGADGRVAGVDALEAGLRRAVWRASVAATQG
jgi:hypothetical protein